MTAKKPSPSARKASAKPKALLPSAAKPLLTDVRSLIVEARQRVAQTVNAGLGLLYWNIGTRIRKDILKEKRAGYGEQIVQSLTGQLTAEFGRGFSRSNLFNMIRFAEMFPDQRIVHSLLGQLGWTHFQHIIYLDDPLKRDFYAEMCRMENWDTADTDLRLCRFFGLSNGYWLRAQAAHDTEVAERTLGVKLAKIKPWSNAGKVRDRGLFRA